MDLLPRQRSNTTRVVVTKPILSFRHDKKETKWCSCIILLSDGTLLTATSYDIRRWSLTEPSSLDTQNQQQQQQYASDYSTTTSAENADVRCLKVYKMVYPIFKLVELDPGESFLCDTTRMIYLIRVEDGTCLAQFSHSRISMLRRLFLLGGTKCKHQSVSTSRQSQQRQQFWQV